MKAISVKDNGTPDTNWATLIEQGIKTIETRTWRTNYRGDLLICCSASSKSDNAGLAVCIVQLDDIVPMQKKHEKAACCKVYPRAQAWLLSNLRPLAKKFPVKGQLRIYEVKVD